MKVFKYIVFLILLSMNLEATKPLIYKKVEFDIKIYKGFQKLPPNKSKIIWVSWRTAECKKSKNKSPSITKHDKRLISNLKTKYGFSNILNLSTCKWKHWQSPEAKVPTKFSIYIFDDCIYSIRFSTISGKYSLRISKDSYTEKHKIWYLVPNNEKIVLCMEDLPINRVVDFNNSKNEKFFLTFSRKDNYVNGSEVYEMDYVLRRFYPFDYPESFKDDLSCIEETLIDVKFDLYGKCSGFFKHYGSSRIIEHVKDKLCKVFIDRYFGFPSLICLRSKFIFIKSGLTVARQK